ncbi:MAG TPA: TrmH family RNA methyltransferase [Rectinemataceae bacterium]|nr:TrmH family RNA methyltransferase [Rectinemataceae bacterium]
MIQVMRLSKLHGVARRRKCAILLERVELELSEIGDGSPLAPRTIELLAYARDLAAFLADDKESSPDLAAAAGACLEGLSRQEYSLAFRAIDDFRHLLMRISGQAPADWDLHDFMSPGGSAAEGLARSFLPGLKVYLEDIRSPFNVGTILRTAEALGFEEVLLSSGCADPRHSRALRSSMGAVDLIPWRRCSPDELPGLGPLFALELGGLPLNEFPFPRKGILVLGSEELGVSAACLRLADGRRVSIPMRGIKASINVAVAFGIAAQTWVSSI